MTPSGAAGKAAHATNVAPVAPVTDGTLRRPDALTAPGHKSHTSHTSHICGRLWRPQKPHHTTPFLKRVWFVACGVAAMAPLPYPAHQVSQHQQCRRRSYGRLTPPLASSLPTPCRQGDRDMTLDSGIVTLARSTRIEDEVRRRGIKLRRVGSEWIGACPVCGGGKDADRFSINTKKQVWNCRGCEKGGSVVDLVMFLDNCDFPTAVRTLAGIEPGRPAPRLDPVRIAEAQAKAERAEIDELVDGHEKFLKAMIIWSEAKPIEETPAEVYLRVHRRLELPPGVSGQVLRFHPVCPFGSITRPCMIALVRNIETNAHQAIHRTALNPDGTALKIDGKTARLSLGPIAGGAIKLTDDAEVTICLGAAEGIETALSMQLTPEFGRSPVWSLISDSGVRDFAVLAGIECLWISVDNDKPDQRGRSAGHEAALACSRRWTEAGREVFRFVLDRVGDDLNDVVRRGAA
jgi:putative DNA primase/helicase